MTQTVILTQPVRVGGSVLAAGTTQTLSRDVAADLVQRDFATPVGVPVWQSAAQNVSRFIAQSNIPFLIMPGDGGSNGCSFSGTAGAFTLSSAIIANIGTALAGCYAYFSANFGGSTLPAGWYWTEFSSDTEGIVYANAYIGGYPKAPTSKTPIGVNLSGIITATTNEVVAINSFRIPAGSLGKTGVMDLFFSKAGSTSGTKTFRAKIDSVNIGIETTTTSPTGESLHIVTCTGSHSSKYIGRATSAQNGLSVFGPSFATASQISIDTSVDQLMSFSIQQSAATATPILMRAYIKATYGE